MTSSTSSFGKWIAIVVILGAIGGGIWYFKNRGPEEPEYRTTKIIKTDITQGVTATGQLNPVLNIEVGSQVSGIIDKLLVDFNSKVTNGQLIAQLDPATYEANLAQAEGELANAQANLELTQVNAKRATELSNGNLIPKSDYDKAIADLHQAEAQVKIQQASLQKVRVDLDRTKIYSPIDGMIISRKVDKGQTVAASLSAPVLYVIANDLSKMQIDANVSEADIGGVEEGQRVTFSVDAFPYRTFMGKVTQVRNAPITNQNVITYDTVIDVNNEDMKLKPGMTANLQVIFEQRSGVLAIPNAAFRFHPVDNGNKGDKSGTNKVASTGQAAPQAAMDAAGDGAGGGERGRGGPGRGGGRRGGGEGRAGSGSGGRPPSARMSIRTIYKIGTPVPGGAQGTSLIPVQIKTGISDGVNTEVTDGLNEGDEIVIGINSSTPIPPGGGQQPGTPNPFGGGGRRGF